jgi:hypothetical protein
LLKILQELNTRVGEFSRENPQVDSSAIKEATEAVSSIVIQASQSKETVFRMGSQEGKPHT